MARRTPEEAEQTRQGLLVTALRLFSEQGVAATTLKEIAREAGVTHGALYWHFKNRADLLEQIHLEFMLPFEAQYLEQRQAVQQDALAALELYFNSVLSAFAKDEQAQQLYRVYYLQTSTLADMEPLKGRLSANRELWLDQLKFFLKQARKQKQIRKKPAPAELAQSLQILLEGVLAHWLNTPGADLLHEGKGVLELVLHGLPQK